MNEFGASVVVVWLISGRRWIIDALNTQNEKLAYPAAHKSEPVTTLADDGGVTILTIAPDPSWLRVFELVMASFMVAVMVGAIIAMGILYFRFRALFRGTRTPTPLVPFGSFALYEFIAGFLFQSVMLFFAIRKFMTPTPIKQLRISSDTIVLHRGRTRIFSRDRVRSAKVISERDIFTKRKSFFVHIQIRRRLPVRIAMRTRDEEIISAVERALLPFGPQKL